MWKWIVGGLLAVVVIGFVGCYVLVKHFASGGDSTSITVAASADRVFASLADADSMSVLMGKGTHVSAAHHGLVAVGDTLRVETGPQSATGGQRYTWIVSELVPGRLLVLEMRNDSSGQVFATRRDSLAPTGDSTLVVSTIASPIIDSLKTERGDTGRKMGGALLNFTSKVVIAGFRLAAEEELRQLKRHVEAPLKPAATRP